MSQTSGTYCSCSVRHEAHKQQVINLSISPSKVTHEDRGSTGQIAGRFDPRGVDPPQKKLVSFEKLCPVSPEMVQCCFFPKCRTSYQPLGVAGHTWVSMKECVWARDGVRGGGPGSDGSLCSGRS